MVVAYSAYAEQKLSIRKIRREDVSRVIEHPTELFEDTEHHAKAAIGPFDDKFLVVIYHAVKDGIKVITVYHTRKLDKLVSSKTQRGAWRRIR